MSYSKTCPECGETPMGSACYHICPNSDSFYSPERERADEGIASGDRYDGWGDPESRYYYQDDGR
jgi:hypothetical protein